MARGSEELGPLANRFAELRERRRWLGKEIAFADCRIAEARFERGQMRGRGRRKRRHTDALSAALVQLGRQRDSLVRQLDTAEIELGFEISPPARNAWAVVVESFNVLRRCNGIANVPLPEPEFGRRGGRQDSGLPERPLLFPPAERWETIRCEVAPLHLRTGDGTDLLFLPGFLLLRDSDDHLALIDIRDIKLSILEPQAAAHIAPATGRGAPPPGVRTLPVGPRVERVVTRPPRLLLTSETGLREIFDIGDRNRCGAFVEAMASFQSTLPDKPFVLADPDPAERMPSLDIPERFELPTMPPLRRWPVGVAGLAVAGSLLWMADHVTGTDSLNRLAADAGTLASQASDEIAALFAEGKLVVTEEMAAVDRKSGSLDAIGVAKSRAVEQTPPEAGQQAPPEGQPMPPQGAQQTPQAGQQESSTEDTVEIEPLQPAPSEPTASQLALPQPSQPEFSTALELPLPPERPETEQTANVVAEAGGDANTGTGVEEGAINSAPAPAVEAAPAPAFEEPVSENQATAALPAPAPAPAAEPSPTPAPVAPVETAAVPAPEATEAPAAEAAASSEATVPFLEPTSELARSEVVILQQKLQELGFRPGAVDGVVGRRTLAAVQAFQRTHGLPRTLSVDRQILQAVLDASMSQPTAVLPQPQPVFQPSVAPVGGQSGQLRRFPWPYVNVPRPMKASELGR